MVSSIKSQYIKKAESSAIVYEGAENRTEQYVLRRKVLLLDVEPCSDLEQSERALAHRVNHWLSSSNDCGLAIACTGLPKSHVSGANNRAQSCIQLRGCDCITNVTALTLGQYSGKVFFDQM